MQAAHFCSCNWTGRCYARMHKCVMNHLVWKDSWTAQGSLKISPSCWCVDLNSSFGSFCDQSHSLCIFRSVPDVLILLGHDAHQQPASCSLWAADELTPPQKCIIINNELLSFTLVLNFAQTLSGKEPGKGTGRLGFPGILHLVQAPRRITRLLLSTFCSRSDRQLVAQSSG